MSELTYTRPRQVYLSYVTHKGLELVAQAKGGPVDELADSIIRDWLTKHHPEVLTYLDERWKEEKAFRKQLTEKLQQEVPF